MPPKIAELLAQRGALIDKMNTQVADAAAFDATEKELEALDGQIERAKRAMTRSASLARPVDGDATGDDAPLVPFHEPPGTRESRAAWGHNDYLRHARTALGFKPDKERHFESFGDLLGAVARHYSGDATDRRLVRAPTGAGETDGSAGGFLVQTDFATAIITRAYDMGEILGRVFKLPISANSNGIKIPGVDESSRATGSRWGGVQSYWVGEGDAATATKPKFRLIELDLKKLMSVMYTSDELLQDSTALTTIANQAFSEELVFMTEDSCFEGDGVGKPLGIMNAPCLVTVPKDTGQAAGTLSYQNILNMWSRMWARSRKNAVWMLNQDVEPQLFQLAQTIGVAGVPVYLPPNGISGAPYGILFGRPVIPTEYSSSLGTSGDIILADWSQYVLADKRGVQAATSMHVRFLTDEMTFRITYRVDGEPTWHTPLTPFKGTSTKSPFIALANRS